jgi:class 3 adenylate cyclase
MARDLVIDERTAEALLGVARERSRVLTPTDATAYLDSHGIAVARASDASATRPQRVDLAFLFVDIDDSMPLLEALGDADYYSLLALHNEAIESTVRANGGEVVKHTGDGYFATFRNPSTAVGCALAIQSRFPIALGHAPSTPMLVAVGVHAGEGMAARGDVYGLAVSMAARICALGDGGEVLISDKVRSVIPPGRFRFVDRGGVSLKGFSGDMRIYQALNLG